MMSLRNAVTIGCDVEASCESVSSEVSPQILGVTSGKDIVIGYLYSRTSQVGEIAQAFQFLEGVVVQDAQISADTGQADETVHVHEEWVVQDSQVARD